MASWASPWSSGNQTVTFRDTGQRLGGGDSYCVALADIDLDDDIDALVTNADRSNVLWLNDGTGMFTNSGQDLGSGTCIALADLDDDSDVDAFVTGDSNRVLLNDGTGGFSDTGQLLGEVGAESVSLGDLDRDGDLDAFLAYWGHPRGQPNRVWLNDGVGSFTDSGQRLGTSASSDVVLADVDGDGDLDAFVANQADSTHHPLPNAVWLNDGRAGFTHSGQAIGNACSYSVQLGDLDGDGDLDAFVANSSHARLSDPSNKVWFGDGASGFFDSGQKLGMVYSLAAVLGDLDGDGDLDAYVGNYRDADRVWLNDGRGRFLDSGLRLGNSNGHDIVLGDLDGDGDLAAFVVNNTWQGGDGTNTVWLNHTGDPSAR
jgi:hypothetical protein